MKGMKRILAMLLAVVMVVGLIPATVFAAENVLDAAIFCSDVHGSTSDLTSVMTGVETSGVDYSSIGFVGDTCLTVANTTSIVQTALGDTDIAVMFSYAASHDTENSADISTNWDYSGEVEGVSKYYLVYTIRETDMQNDTTAEDDFTTWYSGLTAAQKKLPIFIMSHRPLHHRRKDNANATDWYNAISAAAKSSDIVVFWAHNHTSENSVDTAAYYVAKNGTETITLGTTSSSGGDTVTPNFTYMNAGYINANNQDPARLGVATTVQITANSLIFQDYNSSGTYSGTYAHNVTVAREFAASEPEVTLESITVSGTPTYYVGDAFVAPTVTAVYSDTTKNTVLTAEEYTVTGTYDMKTADTYTLTYTYQEKTATYTFEVKTDSLSKIAVTTNPTKTSYITGETLDTAGMVVTATYESGKTAEVTGWYTSTVDMTTAGEKEVTVNYVVDSITYKTTFTITVEEGVAESVTLTGIEITSEPTKTEYLVGQALNLDGLTVVATFSDGSTKELSYKPFSTSTVYGGYELDDFNMHVKKAHNAVVSYTFGENTYTDTFVVNVWNVTFEDTDSGVSVKLDVDGSDYGVTAVNVTESTNTYVESAIGNYISTDNYKAYDITLTLDTDGNYALTNGNKTVTLPIPENVANPVVCYVSEDGLTVDQMDITNNGDGTVSFETNHFSIYVIGDSAEDPEKDLTLGDDETKTVYVLVDTPTAGNQYIIVSSGTAGGGYALKENTTTGTSVTINAASGNLTAPYIETSDETIMWNATSGLNFQSENGGYYLNYSESMGSYSVSFSTSSASDWSTSTNALFREGTKNDYYLRYNSGWTMGGKGTTYNVYFYEKQTVSVSSKVKYEVSAENIEHIYSTIGATGEYEALTYELLANGEAVSFDGEVWTVKVVSDPSGIIDTEKSTNETLYFTGATGTATMRVYYELDDDGDGVVDYKVWTTFTVTASNPYYTIDLHYAEMTKVEITEFAEGVTYYTFDSVTNTYHVATEYVEDTTYYTTPVIQGKVIDEVVTLKGIEAGDTYSVWAVVKEHNAENPDGKDLGALGEALSWTVSDTSIATIDTETGVITFTGNNYGTFTVTVSYKGADGKVITDTITISVTESLYTVPGDGTNDFPEYPNEGAVRHDKTATAVGNFSETGIAKIELSMTGVPYTTGSELDVVLMLDITGSMTDGTELSSYTYSKYPRVEYTILAAQTFVETIVVKEDGSYNDNRVGVYSFNSGGTYTLFDLGKISSDDELKAAKAAVATLYDDYKSGGTPYDDGLAKVQSVLSAAKTDGTGNDRQQFAVFMTDGVPTDYEYITGTTHANYSSASSIAGMLTSSDDYCTRDTDYYYEYYSTEMKNDGITVYTVGIGLENTNSAWSGTAAQCLNLASRLLNDISGPANETTQPDAVGTSTLSKQDSYFFSVADSDAATEMENVFENIANDILAAATDVAVTDQIGSNYTMVFDAPNAVVDENDGAQEYYIEVTDYKLTPVYAADGTTITDYTRGTATSLLKLYFGYNDSTGYYAATDSTGTAAATPTFDTVTLGEKGTKYYWTTVAADGDSGVSVVGADGTTYYFVSAGNGTHNMTAGAYASGTLETEKIYTLVDIDAFATGVTYYYKNADGEYVKATTYNENVKYYTYSESSTCQNMIIATPYFVYNAATKMLVWTLEEISNSEVTLTYFLYLNNSGGFSGTDNEITPATYTTNTFAKVSYTNYKGNDCELTFPVPQMTWNGAQVSYVFYLVNAAGQPVNRAGRVVPFSEAVYVTDVHTYAIIWNDLEQSAGLDAERLAKDLVPDVYALYDNDASYNIHVYEDQDQSNLNNHFVIGGDVTDAYNTTTNNYPNANTTYVFNTKADATKYNVVGAYVGDDGDTTKNETGLTYLCKDYNVVDGAYNTIEKEDPLYGTYYAYEVTSATYNGEATQWTPGENDSTTGGTVLADGHVYYVDENGDIYTIVIKTDGREVEAGFDFHNTTVAFAVVWKPELHEDVVVVDFGLDVVVDVIVNDAMAAGVTGVMLEEPDANEDGTYADSVGSESVTGGDGLWTAYVESLTSVRFRMNKMGINAPAVFYYEAGVNYYDSSNTLVTTSMYSSVTVIPATTVYYEDSFVTYTGGNTEWTVEGTTSNKTQAVDRPGVNKLNDTYDADNVYGYDAAYDSVSTYSMGSAHKIHVDANSYGNMEFSFWGTGFDVISMTSSATGTLVARIFDADGNRVANKVVDTYYGYNYGWCKVTYTYTLVEEAKEATDATEATEAVYSWVKTNYVGADAEGTNEEKPEDPQEGAQYTAYEYGWYPCADENALYQVPVIQANGLDYGYYKVTIIATYAKAFDHTADDGYDLYLDAIRIYDPTGDLNASANDAYKADNEANPNYTELRNNVISASNYQVTENEDGTTVTGDEISGLVFIDGKDSTNVISDYVSYGPNNELYLANGQAIAFNVTEAAAAKDVQLGIKLASGDSVTYKINGDSYTVSTATDMYYSILQYAQAGTVVIQNVSSGILSLTNIKVTYAPADTETASLLWMDGETATFALMSLRRAPADTDDSVSGDTTDTETEDTVTDGNTNTGNTTGDNTNTEVEDTVTGETNAPEADDTATEGNGTDDTTTNEPAEDIPAEEIPEEDTPAEEETTEEPAEQLGFWARLWNAIKNAFNRLFSWFGF